jgi:hypothetical protein
MKYTYNGKQKKKTFAGRESNETAFALLPGKGNGSKMPHSRKDNMILKLPRNSSSSHNIYHMMLTLQHRTTSWTNQNICK